jgi:hypothetical protein
MTLTVRLDAATESALDRYCAERGVTKSLVVQESLAVYLIARQGSSSAEHIEGSRGPSRPVSANYKAFADAGLIGCIASGQTADKAGVRARMAEHFAQRKARQAGS